mmetsp:Transcript_30936/g.62800  ORF Transcript_30936/g.62800 Transcript_30936/m.62800 type:complete len:327 (-) Transcript_30936:1406-2386(-)
MPGLRWNDSFPPPRREDARRSSRPKRNTVARCGSSRTSFVMPKRDARGLRMDCSVLPLRFVDARDWPLPLPTVLMTMVAPPRQPEVPKLMRVLSVSRICMKPKLPLRTSFFTRGERELASNFTSRRFRSILNPRLQRSVGRTARTRLPSRLRMSSRPACRRPWTRPWLLEESSSSLSLTRFGLRRNVVSSGLKTGTWPCRCRLFSVPRLARRVIPVALMAMILLKSSQFKICKNATNVCFVSIVVYPRMSPNLRISSGTILRRSSLPRVKLSYLLFVKKGNGRLLLSLVLFSSVICTALSWPSMMVSLSPLPREKAAKALLVAHFP